MTSRTARWTVECHTLWARIVNSRLLSLGYRRVWRCGLSWCRLREWSARPWHGWVVGGCMLAERRLLKRICKSGKHLGELAIHLIQPRRIPVGKSGSHGVSNTHLCNCVRRGTRADGEQRVVHECVVSGGKVVFLLVHLLLQYDLFGDLEGLACPFLMYLGGGKSRLDTSLETPVASPGGSNVGSLLVFRGGPLTLFITVRWILPNQTGASTNLPRKTLRRRVAVPIGWHVVGSVQ